MTGDRIIKKGKMYLGKVDGYGRGVKNCKAFLTYELRQTDKRLEFSGCGEVWNHIESDSIRCGQCVEEVAALSVTRTPQEKRLVEIWKRWHLNGMNAGCEHQRAEGWKNCPGHYSGPITQETIDHTNRELKETGVGLVRGSGRHYYCTDEDAPVDSEKCAGNVQPLCKPCPVCGYQYGSAWLYEPIPQAIIDEIMAW